MRFIDSTAVISSNILWFGKHFHAVNLGRKQSHDF